MATNERAAAVDFDVKINGTEVPDADVISFTTESDFDQPDTASVVLRNDVSGYNEFRVPTPGFASDPAWSPLIN